MKLLHLLWKNAFYKASLYSKDRNHENVANWKSLQLQLGFSGDGQEIDPSSSSFPFLPDDFIVIDNLSDLESAGVLASYGYLESIDDLQIQNIDVTSVPSNILISLTSVVHGLLTIQEVDGFKLSMLGNLNPCQFQHQHH